MENIFYKLIMMHFFIGKRQVRSRRQTAKQRFGFKRLGIFIESVKGAAELVEVFVAEIIMTDHGCAEENKQEKKEQRSERFPACWLDGDHDNYLFFNELVTEILYCPDLDLSI